MRFLIFFQDAEAAMLSSLSVFSSQLPSPLPPLEGHEEAEEQEIIVRETTLSRTDRHTGSPQAFVI